MWPKLIDQDETCLLAAASRPGLIGRPDVLVQYSTVAHSSEDGDQYSSVRPGQAGGYLQ